MKWLEKIGRWVLNGAEASGDYAILNIQTLKYVFKKPFDIKNLFKQMERIGVNSLPVVLITALFTGMVLALQIYGGFKRFQAESMVGAIVGIALSRELAPVLTGLMVAGRIGSSIAAEIGTMRVTEQIDALEVMGVDPVHYLFVPRVLAGTLMLPLLVGLADLIGIYGGHFLVVNLFHENPYIYMKNVYQYTETWDVVSGLIKSFFFGYIIASVGCYKGLRTRGGAEGVGLSTTEAVVIASLTILIADFFLSKLLF